MDALGLVVIDIDGTMVGPDLVVSIRLKRVLAELRARGAVVSVATGRMKRSASRFAIEAGASGPAVCYQGAMTFRPATGEVTRHERLNQEAATRALEVFASFGCHVNLYLDDEIYATSGNDWSNGYQARQGLEIRLVEDLGPYAAQGATLLLGVAEPGVTGEIVAEALWRLRGVARVTHSLPHFCEIGSPRAGKERAVAAIAAGMGIGREQVVAFGDGAGDAGMLEWAGLGVAIDGGHADATAAADRGAPGPGNDGVAEVLEELLAAGRMCG